MVLPVAVEVGGGQLVTVAGGELLAGEDELNPQLALGRPHFGEEDDLASAPGSGRPRGVADFIAVEVACRDAHTLTWGKYKDN